MSVESVIASTGEAAINGGRPSLGRSVNEVLDGFKQACLSQFHPGQGPAQWVEAMAMFTDSGALAYRWMPDGLHVVREQLGHRPGAAVSTRRATQREHRGLEENLMRGSAQITMVRRADGQHIVLHQATGRELPMSSPQTLDEVTTAPAQKAGGPAPHGSDSAAGPVVIVHPEHGVYLGCAMGMGFWSKIDPVGQDAAVTFESAEAATAHMAQWESGIPDGVSFYPVQADMGQYASIQACVQAGLEGWVDSTTPTANERPC